MRLDGKSCKRTIGSVSPAPHVGKGLLSQRAAEGVSSVSRRGQFTGCQLWQKEDVSCSSDHFLCASLS